MIEYTFDFKDINLVSERIHLEIFYFVLFFVKSFRLN